MSHAECPSTQITCSSGLSCIQTTDVCDGRADCADYTDEFGCGTCTLSIRKKARKMLYINNNTNIVGWPRSAITIHTH